MRLRHLRRAPATTSGDIAAADLLAQSRAHHAIKADALTIQVERRIFFIRGHKVMLDYDLAEQLEAIIASEASVPVVSKPIANARKSISKHRAA